MVQLQKDHDKLEAAGVQIVALSYDSVEILKKFGTEQNIKYSLLSDLESKTIDAYKIRNKKVRFPQQDGIPHPTTFVVDKDGVIRAKLPGTTRKRHTTDDLLEAFGKMKAKDK